MRKLAIAQKLLKTILFSLGKNEANLLSSFEFVWWESAKASSLLVQCQVMDSPLAVLGYFQESLILIVTNF